MFWAEDKPIVAAPDERHLAYEHLSTLRSWPNYKGLGSTIRAMSTP
jgi:hypothetical protein